MALKELDQLKKLDLQKQLAFAYLCCERFYPNYVFFSDNHNFGDTSIMRRSIDFIFNAIFAQTSDTQELESLLNAADANGPRPDNFATFYASIAMYTAGVIYESLNLVTGRDNSRILNDISTMCIDAVDLFIQERDDMDYDDADFENKILNDPLMKQEITLQKGSIGYLQRIKQLQEADMTTLLQLQERGTGSLIMVP